MTEELPYPPNLCLSTLRPTSGEPYSRAAVRNLWGGRKASPILKFDLPDFHSFRRDHADRISISGVQDKISLRLYRGKLEPADAEGEYLLKPIPSSQPLVLHDDIPANEHVTMQIAAQLFDIETAASGLVFFPDGKPAFIARRFDRDSENGEKLPQEDFCQISGRTSSTHGKNFKYDGSYEELGELVRSHCAAAAIEMERLFRLIVFNYVFANGDAHMKNFSLMQNPSGDYRFTPAYDLMSTTLHLPNEERTALELFKNDFQTETFKQNAFYTGADFTVLAERFGLVTARGEGILEAPRENRSEVGEIVGRSLLSAQAKENYLALIDDRLRALLIR